MNVIVAGPCGVGKSTIAKSFADSVGMVHLDFDELRAMDVKEGKTILSSPCSVSTLNLKECLSATLDKISSSFILDIGGDTVFRRSANNEKRLNQILWLKKNYSAKILLFVVTKDILFQRFAASKNRSLIEFDDLWADWQSVIQPYWQRCADLIVDTTNLSIDDTVMKMKKLLVD